MPERPILTLDLVECCADVLSYQQACALRMRRGLAPMPSASDRRGQRGMEKLKFRSRCFGPSGIVLPLRFAYFLTHFKEPAVIIRASAVVERLTRVAQVAHDFEAAAERLPADGLVVNLSG